MSYAIIRNANYKKEQLAGLYKHNERKNTNYSNKDIAKDKSKYNYSIKKCNTTYYKLFQTLQKENNLKGRIIKTTNLVCEFIITSDKEFFEEIGEEETKRYFQTAYNFVAQYKNLGEKYILSANVHMDESTPHLHLVFMPVIQTKDKEGNVIEKIACSEYWKGKDSYRELQDNFYKYIKDNGFDLERGKTSNIEHINTETLKQITNYENIKYELENEKINTVDEKSIALVIQQNKELIQYTNKLRIHLSKALVWIKEAEKLEIENRELKDENKQLKKTNHKLKRYIESTFNVVRNLFSFPMDSFKNLVDNFMNRDEKKY